MKPARWLVVIVILTGSAASPKTQAAGKITRQEAIQTAEAYRFFAWTPTARNVFHGRDRQGVRVDTPDWAFQCPGNRPGWWVPGVANVGVPYQWGGFSSLEEFARGIAAGRYAGDVYTADKRRQLDGAVSHEAVGIDCSGLVSRCWKLNHAYSTRMLPGLCVSLLSYEQLKPGDILNTDNQHVLLFKAWRDGTHQRLLAYEAGGAPPTWKVLLDDIPVALLRGQNYRAYRYRLMRD